jgi:hypothetical protein
MEVHESPPAQEISTTRRQRQETPDSRRVVTFTSGSAGRLDSLPNFTDTETSAGGLNTGDEAASSFFYSVKQDVRDKIGRLKGILDLEASHL